MEFANLKKNLKFDYLAFLVITRSFFKDKNFLKHFGFIFGLYLIGYFGFLTSDFLHNDDINRLIINEPDFKGTGRFISEYLSFVIHMDYPYISYISPLTQLFAIVFLSLASMVLVKIVNKKISYFGLVASLLVGLSPVYLENMLFKYDSPYLALATLCAILPFLFMKRLSLFFTASLVFLLIMWNTYQANNGIYIVLTMFISLNLFLKNANLKQIYKFILSSAFVFCISVLVTKLLLVVFKTEHSYIDQTIQLVTTFEDFKKNFSIFTRYLFIIVTNNHIFEPLFFATCIFFGIVKFTKKQNQNFIFPAFFIVAFIYIGFYATFGVYYVFKGLLFSPRFYTGLGVFIAIMLIDILSVKTKFINFAFKGFAIIFAYSLIATATVYINTINLHDKYIRFRMLQVYSFLQNHSEYKGYDISMMSLYGVGTTQAIANGVEMINGVTFPIKMVSYWTSIFHKQYYSDNFKFNQEPCKDKVLKKTIETDFNIFDIYDRCINVKYIPLTPFSFNAKFNKSILSQPVPPFIMNRKIKEGVEFTFYNRVVMPFMNVSLLDFSDDISKFANADDDSLQIQFFIKNSDKTLDIVKNIKDFKKYNGRYYYTIGFANLTLPEIIKIRINFYNKKTKTVSSSFDIKWREDLDD